MWMEETCHCESGFLLVTWCLPQGDMTYKHQWLRSVISLQSNYGNSRTYISSLFVWCWTSLSHNGKNEYFSCGCNESIHNTEIITQMTEGSWKSGHALMITTGFYDGIRFPKRQRNEFHDCLFTFSDSPQEIDWKWEKQTVVWCGHSKALAISPSVLGQNERCMWRIGRFKSPVWICILSLTTCVFLVDANSPALWTDTKNGSHLKEPGARVTVWEVRCWGTAFDEPSLPAKQWSLWTHYRAFPVRLDHLPSWGSPRLWTVFQWSLQKDTLSRETQHLYPVHWYILVICWIWFGFAMAPLPVIVWAVDLIQVGSFGDHF